MHSGSILVLVDACRVRPPVALGARDAAGGCAWRLLPRVGGKGVCSAMITAIYGSSPMRALLVHRAPSCPLAQLSCTMCYVVSAAWCVIDGVALCLPPARVSATLCLCRRIFGAYSRGSCTTLLHLLSIFEL
jgi:hypothetical protein